MNKNAIFLFCLLVLTCLSAFSSEKRRIVHEEYPSSGKTEIFNNDSNLKIQNPLKLYYFFKPGCRTCASLETSLNYLSEKYPDKVKIFFCNINNAKSKVINEALCIRYSVPGRLHLATPSIFFGKEFFIGEKSIRNQDVSGKILESIKNADKLPTPEFSMDELIAAERTIDNRYDKINWAAVLSAGLIDGINPCAFVTIVFLLSYLALMEYGRKGIILVGLSFTLAVFITYLLIGLGFLKFADYLQSIPNLSSFVYYSGAVISGFVGIMNLADYLKMKKGSLTDMNLKLNDSVRMKINTVIRKNIKLRHYVVGAAVIGFSVSILELTCTGQTYLPTVLFIVNTQGALLKAMIMLIFYNVAFIIPLIAVFMLSLAGVTDKKFSAWLKNHATKIKLATGIVFIVMATVILMM